jgi:hypothetical protein
MGCQGEGMGERGGGRGGGGHDEVGRQRRMRTRQPLMTTTATAGDRKKGQSANVGGS